MWIGLGALTLPLLACQLLVGIEERYVADAGPDATSRDGAPDVARDGGHDSAEGATTLEDARADRVNACPPGAQPPPPPSSNSMTGAMPIDFYVAVRSLSYDLTTDAGLGLGYDLDNACTCEGKPPGPPSCVNDASKNCDGDAGRDLAGNTLLTAIDSVGGSSVDSLLNSKIASGQVTLIFQVGGYNLGADDTSVTLSVFVAGGLLGADAGPDSGFIPPKWDGTDVWSIDPRSASSDGFVDGGWEYVPLFIDTMAYVKDYTLVAALPSLALGLGEASLSLTDAVLVAKIEGEGMTGGHQLTGQIAGRVSVSTIFALASTFSDPMTDGGQNYCGNDVVFQAGIRPIACQAADIMSSVALDNKGQGCDALSLAFGFVAQKVLIGAPHEGINPVVGCDGSVANCEGLP